MKNLLIVIWFPFLLFSQSNTEEFIIMFKKNVVIPKTQSNEGDLNDFNINSSDVLEVFKKHNLKKINKLIKNFTLEQRTVNLKGNQITLNDWSDVYLIEFDKRESNIQAVIDLNKIKKDVVYCEPNYIGTLDGIIPSDSFFVRQWSMKNDGTEIQGGGMIGADIKVTDAWTITTGNRNANIAVIDVGMNTLHPEFDDSNGVTRIKSGSDPSENTNHGTAVAGIISARGNNNIGIAGISWDSWIINLDFGDGPSVEGYSQKVYSAIQLGSNIINCSNGINNDYSITLNRTFCDAYKTNISTFASMGNDPGNPIHYPAALDNFVTAVGATTNNDIVADYSNFGPYIDIVAPGGHKLPDNPIPSDYYKQIYTTNIGTSYAYFWGTSAAAPHASGVASLLISYNPNLFNDDIKNIIQLSCDTPEEMEGDFDQFYGHGRINAKKALDYLRNPFVLQHLESIGGVATLADPLWYNIQIFGSPGLPDDEYVVQRYTVTKNVNFIQTDNPVIWGRGVSTIGWSDCDTVNGVIRNFTQGFCEAVPGTITPTSATLRTYVYRINDGEKIKWYPCPPAQVKYSYTVWGEALYDKKVTKSSKSNLKIFSTKIYQNYPNPFNPKTKIEYYVSQKEEVTIRIYNVLGEVVKTLVNQTIDRGNYIVEFDGATFPSGTYFCLFSTSTQKEIKTMVLLK